MGHPHTRDKVLVTGASGFLGAAIYKALLDSGYDVDPAFRTVQHGLGVVNERIIDLDDEPSRWQVDFSDYQVIVHAAALVHQGPKSAESSRERYLSVNCNAAVNLATAAAAAGVKTFIFISSTAVFGSIMPAEPGEDELAPDSPYGESKLAAERRLTLLASQNDMRVIIIRPSMIYGADAPGNPGLIIKALKLGIPLPISLINNKRHMITISSMVQIVVGAFMSDIKSGSVFVAADSKPLSIVDLVKSLAQQHQIQYRLWKMPPQFIKVLLIFFGKRKIANQILEDYVIGEEDLLISEKLKDIGLESLKNYRLDPTSREESASMENSI